MSRLLLAAVAAIVLWAGVAQSQELITLEGVGPGSYVLTIGADGSATLRPTRLVRIGTTPPPTDPQPPPPTLSPFAKQISLEATEVINAGGSKTTAAGLSEVYSIVGGQVASGGLAHDQALSATSSAVAAVMAVQADRDAWKGFRDNLTATFAEMQQKGELTTKEQYATVLKDVAVGLAHAAGYTPAIQEQVDASNPSQPFIGGLDLAQIIELIKVILEVLKLFGIGQ